MVEPVTFYVYMSRGLSMSAHAFIRGTNTVQCPFVLVCHINNVLTELAQSQALKLPELYMYMVLCIEMNGLLYV